ncbi:hypothetical protein E4U42_000836 [Claviceps africana]|uniref:G-protein coupled receptors family 2 profile 2 domain-containing protein n=1 Tax=Claviceps africana TaxID=83212 RepID=A0A8K0IZY7_9HYPO|nr:hypothetical protein E4U42_000836 [Claviceps africana]
MAINVFLVFYFRTSPDSFRQWWWIYCVVCYGGLFVLALTLLLVRSPAKGGMYGDATIWCWIDARYDGLRIYTYYLCVWICITGSILCYFLVGYHVFRSRNRLHSFSATKSRDEGRRTDELPSANCRQQQDSFDGIVTTEFQTTRTSVTDMFINIPETAHLESQVYPPSSPAPPPLSPTAPTTAQYLSAISATPPRFIAAPEPSPRRRLRRVLATAATLHFFVEDPIKRAYLRTSLLFALSVLVTWTPSSLNRIYGWLEGHSPYQLHVATSAVLPLQGLWNSLIFFISSWGPVRHHLAHRLGRLVGPGTAGASGRVPEGVALGTEGDSGVVGSHVELRRVDSAVGKASPVL